jgi:pimeloyl-ACP methyl ester carboxylesterase
MSLQWTRCKPLLLLAAVAIAGGSASADTATFPVVPRDQYSTRLLHYQFTPEGGDTSVTMGPGYLQPVYDDTNSIIGSTYVSDNCRQNNGSCPPELTFRFAGPADQNGFRYPRFVKDVHFRLIAAPGSVKVCGGGPCQTITPEMFRQTGWVDVTLPDMTANVSVAFPTPVQFNVNWRFQIDDHIEFTPVAHADHPIVFIPGIAASELRDDQDTTVWPSLSPFIFSSTPLSLNPADAAPPLHATDVLREISVVSFVPPQDVYGEFLRTLAANKYTPYQLVDPVTHRFNGARLAGNCTVDSPNPQPKLFVFPYDWRRTNVDTAGKLADYLKCVAKYYPNDKVDIVAHSMGGLVARRMLLSYPEARDRVRQVVTVATPYLGAAKAIAVEFNGAFMEGFGEILTAPSFIKLSPYYPGVHELLPSQPSFPPNIGDPVPPPFRFFTYTPGDAGLRIELATYPTFVDLMDASVPETRPGSANRSFHDFNGQDDWRSDATGIPVTQYYGQRKKGDTIVTATRYQRMALARSGPDTYEALNFDRMEYLHSLGDGTVPVNSANRSSSLLPPNMTPIAINSESDQALQHNRLPLTGIRNIITLLADSDPTPTASRSRLRAESDDGAVTLPSTPTEESIYVSLLGSGPIVLRAPFGTFDSSIAAPQWLPGVSVDAQSNDSWSLVLTRDTAYTVTFVATGKPFQVDLLQGLTDEHPRLAYRFMDVNVAAGTEVTLQTQNPFGIPQIIYDGPGGFGIISATNISSPGFVDMTAPEVSISGQSTITITATDTDSGLWRVFYSTDGKYFHPYTQPFAVDPARVQTVYAFADDFDGNRSGAVTYALNGVSSATSLLYTGPASGTVGQSLTLSARLTGKTGSTPVVGQVVAFLVGGTTVSGITDGSGSASVVVTPAHAGNVSVTATFAATASYGASTTSGTLSVSKAVPVITWSTLATVSYGVPLTAAQLNAKADVAGAFTYLPPLNSVLAAGPAKLSVTFTPASIDDYVVAIATTVLTVTPAPLLVAVTNSTKQYGGALPEFAATYDGFVAGDTPNTLRGSITFATPVTAFTPPGQYVVMAGGLSSPNYAISFAPGQLTVLPAAVGATFTGTRLGSVTGSPAGTVSLLLGATIRSLDGGNIAGDLRQATLTFVDRDRNTTLCTASVGLIVSGGTTIGVGACAWTTSFAESTHVTVGSIVGGYYVRDSRSDDVSVAIYPPNDHFLTGGGFLSPTTSAGAIGADAGTKVHFTVDARLKGSQPAIEGRVSVSLQHTDEMARRHSYAVEVRTLGSFATNPEATRAVITGMATTITDVSDPAHPVVLATNGLLELTTTQASAGHDAKLALTLWKADGGLWFTNSWHSTEAVEEPLAGGAIQIH